MRKKFTDRQKRFCEEYLVDLNGKNAAERAGYKHPCEQAKRLLKTPHVAAAIKKGIEERSKRTQINSDWVLKELHELYLRFKASVKPQLNSKTGKPIKDEEGNPVYTFSGPQALKALELIGRHTDVQAWEDKLKVEEQVTLIDKLHAGRARAAARSKDVAAQFNKETDFKKEELH